MAYASSASSVVLPLAPASSSAVFRSASETKGTPPASSTCASSFTRAGIAGFCWIFARNAVATVAIMTEPASAVPIDAPRFVIVFWTPPTSGLSSSGTAETVTLPSCEASAPIPSPTSSIGTKTTSGPASSSSNASRTMVPARSEKRPRRTTRRGETFGNRRGIPIAAISSVIESGSRRAPVASAERPRQTDRKSGTTKKSPACTRYWKKNISRPPLSCGFFRKPGRTRGSFPRDTRRTSQREKTQITKIPPRISQTVGESPAHEGPSGLGWIQPHSLERSTPKTSIPSPAAESTVPTRSRLGRSSTGASAIRRVRSRMASTTRTSPAKTQRHEK